MVINHSTSAPAPSLTPTPSVAMPTSAPHPATSPGQPPCSGCSSLTRNMEIVLSEIDLLRKQNISMQQDISTIVGIAKKASSPQLSPTQDIPQVDPEHPSQPPQETPSPAQDRSPHPRPQAKTSRHTQTNHPPSRETAKPSTKTSRPIRPLFPPCPWQSGFYPQGPVRHLPPSSQQPRS